ITGGPGASFYVATNGSSSGNGSITSPWNLQTALNHPSSVHPGDTIWLRGGTYVGQFTSSLTGTASSPIVVRQYPGERATIDGRTVDPNVLVLTGAYTWYWGFEVTNTLLGAQNGEGVNFSTSNGLKLINLVTHDHGSNGMGVWSQSTNVEVYGCLSYFNGRMTQANHAYGAYGQNQTGEKFLEENFFIHNFGNYPIHIYGSSTAFLDNFRFTGNVFYGGWALIGGSRKAQNPVFTSNYFYGTDVGEGIFDLGWQTQFGPGANNSVLTGNYFMGGTVNFNANNTNTTATGNTFYGRLSNVNPSLYPGNTYFTSASGPVPRPSGLTVVVRPNKYEPGR